ncbi:MAG TPA: glycine zipper 2TM domain-containing protein [Dyella sp.]|uniref:glycine zipper 2TM domain-containing protein n=1 Tax=Dyella sp. TaxID=1869338 RepID=UPI002D78DDCF|nr:glycine zipper 2TM domain-containing protein [Dyella sp.]HET6552486.1 glycine zipper 2TM domain-containing protein [Dyella sp.]
MKTPVVFTAAIILTTYGGASLAQTDSVRHTRTVCENVQVKQVNSSDTHRVAGTAIGAVAGGVLGNQVGGGKGKTLATVGGAVAGGVVGNQVQKNHQDNNATYTTERRCHEEDY